MTHEQQLHSRPRLPMSGVVPIVDDMKAERYIGKTATYVVANPDPRRDSGHMRIPVAIFEAKAAYGRIDVLIRPLDGSGEMWVSLSSLEDVE